MNDGEVAARLKKVEATLDEVLEENRILRASVVHYCDEETAKLIFAAARQSAEIPSTP